ncbi:MAG: hypothetical protein P0S95_00980 [Rhabdochlamydiaceae bacterium]|nr:hypothetical protein [Candidatus Amphrikana amoebophyrae]
MLKIAFLCVANICRSPAMHAVFEKLVKDNKLEDKIYVDSFAITTASIGSDVNSKMQRTLFKNNISFKHTAQYFDQDQFDFFDMILVATEEIALLLKERTSLKNQSKINLLTHYSKKFNDQDIPDPYCGGDEGFDKVFSIIEDSCIALFEKVR